MSCECPICFDPISNTNCTTTECGHTFHSKCIFKNLSQNNGCPLCRKELVEEIESSDDETEYVIEDETEDEEETLEINVSTAPSVFQFTEALKKKGYTEIDFVKLILNEFYYFDEEESSNNVHDGILSFISDVFKGKKSVDYRDKRSYLDVVVGKEKCGETGTGPVLGNGKKKVNFVE